jgi:hypothetical protein
MKRPNAADIRRVAARRAGLVSFVLPIVATLAFWLVIGPKLRSSEASDYSRFYEPVARNVLSGAGLITASGQPAMRYPPGYPILLAATFGASDFFRVPEEIMLQAVVLICVGLCGYLLFRAASTTWVGARALLPTAMWSIYPPALWLTKQPNPEVPFTLLLFLGFVLLLRHVQVQSRSPGGYVVIGAVLGLAMLIRPIAIGLGVLAAAAAFAALKTLRPGRRALVSVLILVGNLLAVAPWELWMYRHTGRAYPLSTLGVSALRVGLTFGVTEGQAYRVGTPVPGDVADLMADIYASYDSLQSTGDVAHLVWREARERPVAVGKLMVLKFVRPWYGTDSHRRETLLLAVQLLFLAPVVAATWVAMRHSGPPRLLAILAWGVCLYTWAMASITLPILRYMTPALGLLFLVMPVLLKPGLTGSAEVRRDVHARSAQGVGVDAWHHG